MADEEKGGEVVQVGCRVKIVFHGIYEGGTLSDRPGYELGTEHEVTEVSDKDVCLNNDLYVLLSEIEVLP